MLIRLYYNKYINKKNIDRKYVFKIFINKCPCLAQVKLLWIGRKEYNKRRKERALVPKLITLYSMLNMVRAGSLHRNV